MIQTQIAALKAVVDADTDASQADKDYMQAVNNLLTSPKVQSFINLIATKIG